jgi:oligopeptide/dipeptide ABC transporter ATP-binding protein
LTPGQWQRLRGNPIAIVFQDPMSYLHPLLRVGRQIAESLAVHDPRSRPTERIGELLKLVKLSPTEMRAYPHELSGGMRQRVLLAIALACRPRLLIADEPTTALDVTTQAEIMALLADLRAQLNMSLLLISHDLALVATSCERVYVMYAGRTVETGSTSALFADPAHPYTHGLLQAALAERDDAGRFATIAGDVPDLSRPPPGCPFEPRCLRRVKDCANSMPNWLASAANPDHAVRCWRPLTMSSP